ncbi:MAG: hypothetical protein AB1644_08645 [Candidatus Zixiibacteriota bacterium]
MHMFRAWRTIGFIVSAGLLVLLGCSSLATKTKFYEPIAAELRVHKYGAAVAQIETARQNGMFGDKDRLLYYLDAGLLYHYASQYDSSTERLHQAELAADELFTKSVSRAAASLLLNDNVLEYAGEDYEILYANLIKALNYLSKDQFDDAFVEVRRANEKLQLLEQKYADAAAKYQRGDTTDTVSARIAYEIKEVRFNNDAFARYLSMHLYAADGKLDDARIDREALLDAFRTQPHIYPFAPPDVRYSSDSGALLSIVALTGLSPVKGALNLRLRTDKDLDLVQIMYDGPDSADVEYGHLPVEVSEDYYFKFSIPQLKVRPSQVTRVRVFSGNAVLGDLQLLEDMNLVAQETFEAKKSLIYFKTIARCLAKGLTTHKMKKKADTGGLGGWLKKAAIDVGTELSENADLRSAQFLPGRVYVADFVVPTGTYDLHIQFLDETDQVIGESDITGCEISADGLNLVNAHWPN